MTQTATKHAPLATSQSFQRGVHMGEHGIWRYTTLGIPLCFLRGEEGLVEVIRNLVSYDYPALSEDLLRQDIGIVVGYALTHPEAFSL